MSQQDHILLSIRDLKVTFRMVEGPVVAVDGVDLEISGGESLGIVGESGSGKSTVAHAVLRLLPHRKTTIEGEIFFDNEDILKVDDKRLRQIRGKEIGMVFQDALSSLDPLFSAGNQIIEAITAHAGMNKKKAYEKALELLRLTGIPEPELRMKSYPHQLSGGMRQRVLFAIAVAEKPRLLIADEPTTALDASIQRQIMSLIREMREKLNLSLMLISHDIAVVSETCDSMAVMYAGKIVEYGETKQCLAKPLHPYLRALLLSHPSAMKPDATKRFPFIHGSLPEKITGLVGCRFAPRCGFSRKDCFEIEPEMRNFNGRCVMCHYPCL